MIYYPQTQQPPSSPQTTELLPQQQNKKMKNKDCDKWISDRTYFVLHLNSILKLRMMRWIKEKTFFVSFFLKLFDKKRLINHLISNRVWTISTILFVLRTLFFNGCALSQGDSPATHPWLLAHTASEEEKNAPDSVEGRMHGWRLARNACSSVHEEF